MNWRQLAIGESKKNKRHLHLSVLRSTARKRNKRPTPLWPLARPSAGCRRCCRSGSSIHTGRCRTEPKSFCLSRVGRAQRRRKTETVSAFRAVHWVSCRQNRDGNMASWQVRASMRNEWMIMSHVTWRKLWVRRCCWPWPVPTCRAARLSRWTKRRNLRHERRSCRALRLQRRSGGPARSSRPIGCRRRVALLLRRPRGRAERFPATVHCNGTNAILLVVAAFSSTGR